MSENEQGEAHGGSFTRFSTGKAVREEEALAFGNDNVAELDKWEAAHFREHKLHKEAEGDYRKRLYEPAARILRLLTHRGTAPVLQSADAGQLIDNGYLVLKRCCVRI